jgi:hypothetical protein
VAQAVYEAKGIKRAVPALVEGIVAEAEADPSGDAAVPAEA